MTLPPEVIKAILEAGGSVDVVVAACEAAKQCEERSKERTRAEWRERQQRSRSSKDQSAERVSASTAPANVTDVTVTPVTSPPSFPPTPPTPITTPSTAAAADAREAAWSLADQIAVICGLDLDFLPPQWISSGPGERVKIWLANGWQREIILAVVRQLVARNPNRPVRSIRFFEAAIAQAHSQIAEPLPVTPTQEPAHAQTGQRELTLLRPVGGGRRVAPDWQASRDAWRAARAKLEASVAGLDDGDRGNGEALPPASTARRE